MKSTWRSLRRYAIIPVLAMMVFPLGAKTTFPGKTWTKVDRPGILGYSAEKLDQARKFTESIDTAAVVIVVDGKILAEWGEVETKFMTHSTRKSMLSALIGTYVRNGTIDLDRTMENLGIDDVPPLTKIEKQATIRDCLKARSGIYHTALYESPGMRARKPKRHSHAPGSFWYYNNWDFNVMCTIFETLTGKKIFEAIESEIARPIGMEHFSAEDGWYVNGEDSIHPAYPFKISARDFARFGLLMLRKGNWAGRQVVPEDWVAESTRYHSDATLYSSDGYGYMWWVARQGNKHPHLPNVVLKDGVYSARGSGGHYVLIIPDYDMVIVHRVNTFVRGNAVSADDMGRLAKLILEARL